MMEQLGINAPAGPERHASRRTERGQLRSGQSQSVSGSAGPADAEERPEGHDAPRCGGSSGARRSSRTSSARSYGRVPKNVPKVTWEVTRDRRTTTVGGRAGRRQAAGRPRRQLRVPGDHRGHPDDAGHAGRTQGAGAGADDVRRSARAAAAAPARRRDSGGRRADRSAATEQLIAAGWGYAIDQSRPASRPTTAPA